MLLLELLLPAQLAHLLEDVGEGRGAEGQLGASLGCQGGTGATLV